jgi:hypothetical protein
VRLLTGGAKKFGLLPLSTLSREDQVFVKNLAAVRKESARDPQ